MTYEGRGAWSAVGGTLKLSAGKTVPGPYYMRPSKGVLAPGVAADDVLLAGGEPDLNEHAVWYGVLALKERFRELIGLTQARDLVLNGRFGTQLRDTVREWQAAENLVADGIVGPRTAEALFLPVVREMGVFHSDVPWTVAAGIVKNESAWDPGAVGSVDFNDHGLCQLNAESQSFSLDQSFHVRTAVDRLYDIMTRNVSYFQGDIRDAIAAYNLGRAGANLWISEGRPDLFIPLSKRDDPNAKPRNVRAYIDRIQGAYS